MQIILDETWKEVLDLLWNYEITEAALEKRKNTLVLEEMNESHVVLVKAELEGPIDGQEELDKLGINVGKLFWVLKKYGTPCRAEIQQGDGEIAITPQNGQYEDKVTLSVKEPGQEESLDLEMDRDVGARNVELRFPLRSAMKIHGVEGFQATVKVENGKLMLDYWTEDSVDGSRSVLGEARGDGASSTYHPELLEPLKGQWDIQLGADQPLEAKKVLGGNEKNGNADVTVVVAPKVKNVR